MWCGVECLEERYSRDRLMSSESEYICVVLCVCCRTFWMLSILMNASCQNFILPSFFLSFSWLLECSDVSKKPD